MRFAVAEPATFEDARLLAVELHSVLRDLDPARFRAEVEDGVRKRLQSVARALDALLAPAAPPPPPPVADRLTALGTVLRTDVPSDRALDAGTAEWRAAWNRYRKRLVHAYDDFAAALKAFSVRVPQVRQTNHARTVFHVSTGLGSILLLEHIVGERGRWLAPLTTAAVFWSLEGLRRVSPLANRLLMAFFSLIAHAHERHRVNSGTWFATALAVLGLCFRVEACAVGLAVLAFGDPFAALIGRRWGTTRIFRQKSLQGSLAFVGMATAAAFTALAIWHPQIPWSTALLVAAAGAVPGALAELFSTRLDDNFSIPITAGAGGALALYLLQVP